jgi:hypothetical protein
MSHQLDFKISYQYQSAKGGVSIPITLTVGSRAVECFAKIDTGSEYCLFQRKLADKLLLD